MSDSLDLKAIAEACKAQQPLRFMRTEGGLFIRNDIGIVFQVTLNPQFQDFAAQNKNYADLVLAATPEVILGLLDKIAMLEPAPEGYVSGYVPPKSALEIELEALKAQVEELRKDSARLDRLERECETYGFEVPEGNRWVLDGPFATARDAIDAILESEVRHEAGN